MTDSSTPFPAAELRPIDVLLYHGTSLISYAIRVFDGTCFSHASLKVEADQVEEALFQGVVDDPLVTSSQGSTCVLARRLKDTPAGEGVANVLRAAHGYLGNPYAYHEILLLALLCTFRKLKVTPILSRLVEGIFSHAADLLANMIYGKKKPLICSEFVYRSYTKGLPGALVIARASFFGPAAVPPTLHFDILRRWRGIDATAKAIADDPAEWLPKLYFPEGPLSQAGEAAGSLLPGPTAADAVVLAAAAVPAGIHPDSLLGRLGIDATVKAIADDPVDLLRNLYFPEGPLFQAGEAASSLLPGGRTAAAPLRAYLAAVLAYRAVPHGIHPDSLLGRLGFDATAKAIADPAPKSVTAELEGLLNVYIEECKAAVEPEAINFPSAPVVAQLGRFGGLLHRALHPAAEPPSADAVTHHLMGLAAELVTPGDLCRSESLWTLGKVM